MPDYYIRPCLPSEAATVARHRVEMFKAMGEVPTEELAAELLRASTAAVAEALRQGNYWGWFAVSGTDVIAGAGAHVKAQLPRIASDGMGIAASEVPLVVNVFTEPQWRNKGIAGTLMDTIMKWALSRGYERVVLHASEAGRPLYEALGFVATNEMRWSPRGGPGP